MPHSVRLQITKSIQAMSSYLTKSLKNNSEVGDQRPEGAEGGAVPEGGGGLQEEVRGRGGLLLGGGAEADGQDPGDGGRLPLPALHGLEPAREHKARPARPDHAGGRRAAGVVAGGQEEGGSCIF